MRPCLAGIAMHKDGVTFSPYSIKDVCHPPRLNRKRALRIRYAARAPSGPTAGNELSFPGLTEWRNSRIEVDADKLPQSMTTANRTKIYCCCTYEAPVSEVSFKSIEQSPRDVA